MKVSVSKVMQLMPPFSEESLKDSIINFYTGLLNLKVVMAVFNHVCTPCERTATCKLTNFQQCSVSSQLSCIDIQIFISHNRKVAEIETFSKNYPYKCLIQCTEFKAHRGFHIDMVSI